MTKNMSLDCSRIRK